MSNEVRFRASMEDKVSAKLRGISGAFDKLGGKGSGASLFGNVGAKAIGVGFGIIASAADNAVGFIFDSIDAASKLQQAVGGVEAVFGPAADSIRAFGKTAADSIGLSERAFSESATIIGAKLTGMGLSEDDAAARTINLEQRAADMAATFGGTTTDAIEAISSALTGERDPIERYGVSIKEADVQARILALGLDTSTTASKKQATALATLSLIQDSTAKTTGKFAAEQDTLAGKQQRATAMMEDQQAALGEKLLPAQIAFTDFIIKHGIPALKTLTDVLDGLGDGWAHVGNMIDFALGKQKKWNAGKFAKNGPPATKTGGGGNAGPKMLASGGWAGLSGPEHVILGDGGEPELVIPRSQLRGGGATSGVRIQGISQRDLIDMIDRGLYFRLQRASTSRVD